MLKIQIKGSTAVSRKATSCSSHGAPRLPHDIQGKTLLTFFKKTLKEIEKVWYNAIGKVCYDLAHVNAIAIGQGNKMW